MLSDVIRNMRNTSKILRLQTTSKAKLKVQRFGAFLRAKRPIYSSMFAEKSKWPLNQIGW